jgi:hypothetical protein
MVRVMVRVSVGFEVRAMEMVRGCCVRVWEVGLGLRVREGYG